MKLDQVSSMFTGDVIAAHAVQVHVLATRNASGTLQWRSGQIFLRPTSLSERALTVMPRALRATQCRVVLIVQVNLLVLLLLFCFGVCVFVCRCCCFDFEHAGSMVDVKLYFSF